MPTSLSVIIVNWNSGNLLAQCVAHLKAQTVQPDRILIVDNDSFDDSLNGIEEYSSTVKLLRMNSNIGFSAANNFALKECNTDLVALLNPDVFPSPDWLKCLVEAACKHPDVAAFGSRQLCQKNPEILDGTGDIYHMSGLAWRNRHGEKQQNHDLILREIFSPCAAAALYRRNALNDIGGFDEDFFCYLEDVDVGFRLRLAGHQAMYVPQAVVCHVGSASTGEQWSDFAVYHGFRNIVWVFVKNMPAFLFWLLLPLHILMNIASIIFFSMRRQGKVILAAKRDALYGIISMWRKRRYIQSHRAASTRRIWKSLDKRLIPLLSCHSRLNNIKAGK